MWVRFGLLAFLICGRAFGEMNSAILDQIETMPKGGGYATSLDAHKGLASVVEVGETVALHPEKAMPGYCSGATYVVLLKALRAMQEQGEIRLSNETWQALVPRLREDGKDTMPDGEGVWGRWNANGPGAARLIDQLQLGYNFKDFARAMPGDFLKIFWTDAVGKFERGHLVIYLGTQTVDGVEQVRFWSSNEPDGFGEKSVPREQIVHAIFSRIEAPERFSEYKILPVRDAYLASLLKTESSFKEACGMSGIR